MPSLVPVEHDPFNGEAGPALSTAPVEHDPFSAEMNAYQPPFSDHVGNALQPDGATSQPGPGMAELRSYQPTFSEKIGNALQDGMMALGADPYSAGHLSHGIRDLLAWTPVGVPMAVGDMKSALDRGDLSAAAINSVGLLPLARPARMAATAARDADLLASRSASLYNPPVKPPRPFAQDYPHGAVSDTTGKLQADIEGRPLGSRFVVGRRMLGGEDVALSPSQSDALTKAFTGRGPVATPGSEIQGDLGRTSFDPRTRRLTVRLADDMTPDTAALVHAHENAHLVDRLVGPVETTAEAEGELRNLYNTLNNPEPAYRKLEAWRGPTRPLPENVVSPETRGYYPAHVDRELWAEAIRAYMADPNYIKTVAPKTAARIREFVNNNPRLNKIIQFNGIAAAPVGVASSAGGNDSWSP
jgi:hypothetical protein